MVLGIIAEQSYIYLFSVTRDIYIYIYSNSKKLKFYDVLTPLQVVDFFFFFFFVIEFILPSKLFCFEIVFVIVDDFLNR